MARGPLPLLVLLGTVCLVAVALVVWMLQEAADPSVPTRRALPDDLDLAVIIDADTLRSAPLMAALERRSRADATTSGPFAELRELLALRRDHAESLAVLEGELAGGVRGDDWLVAVPATPALTVAEWSGALDAPHVAAVSGVLVASSDASLLREARDRLTASDASVGESVRSRVHVTWRLPASAPLLRGLDELRIVELAGAEVAADRPAVLTAAIDVSRGSEAQVEFRFECLADAETGASSDRPADVAWPGLTVEPGTTFVHAAFEQPARDTLDRLVEWLPPSRRRLFLESLVERDTSWPDLAEALSGSLAPGVSVAAARLSEVDGLELDRWDEGHVQPLAATTVRFRWRDPGARGRFEAHLAPHLDLLLGDGVERREVGEAVVLAAERAPLDLNWSLFHPALLLDERGVTLASHRDQLLRALDAGSPRSVARMEPLDRWAVELDGESLARFVEDLRWEHAEVATNRDWGRVRREIRAELDGRSELDPVERAALEDRRVDELIQHRNEVEFPAAIDAWRRRWAWLSRVETLQVGGSRHGRALVGRAVLRLR